MIPQKYLLICISGAIRFGDELTKEQCQDLISSLYSCQLPFQCAHGRPSIVPLVNLTHLTSSTQKVLCCWLGTLSVAVPTQEVGFAGIETYFIKGNKLEIRQKKSP